MAAEMRWEAVAQRRPAAVGVALLAAAAVQLSSWKARQLARCRDGSGCGRAPAPDIPGAWRHGLGLGARCVLCCGNLMLVLLAGRMMAPLAMAAVTLAISAERLGPAPLGVARAAGVAIGLLAALTIGLAPR